MKNGVECYKDFFPYFKALKTNCVMLENRLEKEVEYCKEKIPQLDIAESQWPIIAKHHRAKQNE